AVVEAVAQPLVGGVAVGLALGRVGAVGLVVADLHVLRAALAALWLVGQQHHVVAALLRGGLHAGGGRLEHGLGGRGLRAVAGAVAGGRLERRLLLLRGGLGLGHAVGLLSRPRRGGRAPRWGSCRWIRRGRG